MRDVSHAGIPPGSRSKRALTLSLFLPPEGGTPGSAIYPGVGRGGTPLYKRQAVIRGGPSGVRTRVFAVRGR